MPQRTYKSLKLNGHEEWNEKTSSTTTKYFTGRERKGKLWLFICVYQHRHSSNLSNLYHWRICPNPTPEMDSPYCKNGEWYIGKADSIYGRNGCLERTREDNWYGQNATEEDNVQQERLWLPLEGSQGASQTWLIICNSFVMTYVGVKCLTRHCSVLRDTRTRGTT